MAYMTMCLDSTILNFTFIPALNVTSITQGFEMGTK